MKLLLFLILIPFLALSQINDKVLHVYAGAGITAVTGSIIFYKTKRAALSIAAGLAIGNVAGAFKEYAYDGYFKKGVKSNEDMFATSYGTLNGAILLSIAINIYKNKKAKKQE